LLEPGGVKVGSVHEDFAVESLPGDIFQLGNGVWEVRRVETGQIRVSDAQGQSPTIPFWLGEAPGRSRELSEAGSRIREGVDARIDYEALKSTPRHPEEDFGPAGIQLWGEEAVEWLMSEAGLDQSGAEQLVTYLASASAALGAMPSRHHIVMERFF